MEGGGRGCGVRCGGGGRGWDGGWGGAGGGGGVGVTGERQSYLHIDTGHTSAAVFLGGGGKGRFCSFE